MPMLSSYVKNAMIVLQFISFSLLDLCEHGYLCVQVLILKSTKMKQTEQNTMPSAKVKEEIRPFQEIVSGDAIRSFNYRAPQSELD